MSTREECQLKSVGLLTPAMFVVNIYSALPCSDDTRNDEQTILTRAAHIIERLVSLKVTRHQGQSSSKLLSLYLDWMYNETLELENSLLLIQESLQEIGSAVRKGGVLGNDQQAIGSCLIRNTVPQFWIVSSQWMLIPLNKFTALLIQFGNQTISVPQWLEYLSSSVNYISRRFSQILPLGDDKLPLNFELSAVASPKGKEETVQSIEVLKVYLLSCDPS